MPRAGWKRSRLAAFGGLAAAGTLSGVLVAGHWDAAADARPAVERAARQPAAVAEHRAHPVENVIQIAQNTGSERAGSSSAGQQPQSAPPRLQPNTPPAAPPPANPLPPSQLPAIPPRVETAPPAVQPPPVAPLRTEPLRLEPPVDVAGVDLAPAPTSAQVLQALAQSPPIPPGPFLPTWDSLQANYKAPDWLRDGRFGIMIHWGPYSVAAYHNESYLRHVYAHPAVRDFHLRTFGQLDHFGYVKLADKMGEKFDPEQWAELCRKSGAQYVVPTAEHHDGFSLWDSAANPWNAAKLGPKRDVIGELAQSVRTRGMKFGVSNHSLEHYNFVQRPTDAGFYDLDQPELADFYWTGHSDERLAKFLQTWVAKNIELIDKYQPDLLWIDEGANPRGLDPLKLKVAAYYYNRGLEWGKPVTITAREGGFPAGAVVNVNRGGQLPAVISDQLWQYDDPLGETYGYTSENRGRGERDRDMDVGRPGTYITRLVQTVSRNGNYLLNISPRGDGSIPDNQQRVLTGIGSWLRNNGEAIFGTRPWKMSEEGSTHFTAKGETLYVLPTQAPGYVLTVKTLAAGKIPGEIATIELLGTPGNLTYVRDEEGLRIDIPAAVAEYAPFAIKITGLKIWE